METFKKVKQRRKRKLLTGSRFRTCQVKKYSQVTIKVKKAKNAKKYQYQIATSSKFKKNLKKKTSTKKSVTFKKLKDGAKYFVRVRGINKNKKGKWSKLKTVVVSTMAEKNGKLITLQNHIHANTFVSDVKMSYIPKDGFHMRTMVQPLGDNVNWKRRNRQFVYDDNVKRYIQWNKTNDTYREWKKDSNGIFNWYKYYDFDKEYTNDKCFPTDSPIHDFPVSCKVCTDCNQIIGVVSNMDDKTDNCEIFADHLGTPFLSSKHTIDWK